MSHPRATSARCVRGNAALPAPARPARRHRITFAAPVHPSPGLPKLGYASQRQSDLPHKGEVAVPQMPSDAGCAP